MEVAEGMELIDRSVEPRRVADNPAELLYLFDMVPCRRCGNRSVGAFDDWIREGGDPRLITYIEKCKHCGYVRHVKGWVRRGQPSAPRYQVTLKGPSQVIEPSEFLDEIVRVKPVLELRPPALGVEDWIARERESTHGLTCANELLKFLVDDDTAIPDRLLTPEGLADKGRRPDQYTRAYITEIQKAFLAMDAAFKADAPRFSIDYRKLHPAPVGELSRDTLLAHEKWWRGGRVGPPPLTLKHQTFKGTRARSFEWSVLEDITFDQCFAELVDFNDASLTNVRFRRCNLMMSKGERAAMTELVAERCWMHGFRWDGAFVRHSTFFHCDLAMGDFQTSQWEDVTFAACLFLAARFVGTRFRHCTITPGTKMGIDDEYREFGQTNGAIFEDCDLRGVKLDGRDLSGATFIRCKLAGATGAPRASEGLMLQDCDLSRDEFLAALTAPVTA